MKCFVYEIVRLIMKTIQFRCVFTYLVILYCSIAVFCGSSTLLFLNETENHPSETRDSSHANRFVFETDTILKREKRYLLWTGGGNAQVNWNNILRFQRNKVEFPSVFNKIVPANRFERSCRLARVEFEFPILFSIHSDSQHNIFVEWFRCRFAQTTQIVR